MFPEYTRHLSEANGGLRFFAIEVMIGPTWVELVVALQIDARGGWSADLL